jgi:hypothetical protein
MIVRDRWLEDILWDIGRLPTRRLASMTLERAAILAPAWGRLEVRPPQKGGPNGE